MRSMIQRSDQSFFETDLAMKPITDGDVLATTQAGSPVMLESDAALHVRRPSTGTWVAPGIELHRLHTDVAEIAIPTLVTGARYAAPPLPWSAELGDNGETHETRIMNGGNISGHTRAGAEALRFVEQNQTPPQILKMPPKR